MQDIENKIRLCELSIKQVTTSILEDIEDKTNMLEVLNELIEKPMLEAAYKELNHNASLTARVLGINRGTLRRRLKKHGIIK